MKIKIIIYYILIAFSFTEQLKGQNKNKYFLKFKQNESQIIKAEEYKFEAFHKILEKNKNLFIYFQIQIPKKYDYKPKLLEKILEINRYNEFFMKLVSKGIDPKRIILDKIETNTQKDLCLLEAKKMCVIDILFKENKNIEGQERSKKHFTTSDNKNIYFENESFNISKIELQKIEDIAKKILDDKKIIALLLGFSDKNGSDYLNLELSKARAFEVYKKILSFDIKPSRVQLNFYGSKSPFKKDLLIEKDENLASERKVKVYFFNPKEYDNTKLKSLKEKVSEQNQNFKETKKEEKYFVHVGLGAMRVNFNNGLESYLNNTFSYSLLFNISTESFRLIKHTFFEVESEINFLESSKSFNNIKNNLKILTINIKPQITYNFFKNLNFFVNASVPQYLWFSETNNLENIKTKNKSYDLGLSYSIGVRFQFSKNFSTSLSFIHHSPEFKNINRFFGVTSSINWHLRSKNE